jgi:hypothetical protein
LQQNATEEGFIEEGGSIAKDGQGQFYSSRERYSLQNTKMLIRIIYRKKLAYEVNQFTLRTVRACFYRTYISRVARTNFGGSIGISRS